MPLSLDSFDFTLPDDQIALYPANPRSASRLLVVRPHDQPALSDEKMSFLPRLVNEKDLIVVNNSRVIPANLKAERHREDARSGELLKAKVEITLHKPIEGPRWRAFARPAKRLKAGDKLFFADQLGALVTQPLGEGEIEISFSDPSADLMTKIQALGAMPLPPYIASKRAVEASDKVRYQTSFAKHDGSVAAPTAGLHFDEALIRELKASGAEMAELTLHVGAGTFRPPKSDDLSNFVMHSEWGEINAETAARINQHKAKGGRILAVGTTSLRLLESATDAQGILHPFSGETDIFITPGYAFRLVDRLLTNFHLPRSTLFMLVCAFAGRESMLEAYAHAIKADYRFYSYGDACLLDPHFKA